MYKEYVSTHFLNRSIKLALIGRHHTPPNVQVDVAMSVSSLKQCNLDQTLTMLTEWRQTICAPQKELFGPDIPLYKKA